MIKLDYAKTRACARKLSGAADTCRQISGSAEKLINNTVASWQGASATAFQAEVARWKKETLAIQKELESLSARIIRVANEFEEAEARVAAAADALGDGHSGSR